MRMLITGGAGFIGSYLCDKYITEGHHVMCLDNFLNGYNTNIAHLLDCRNFELIEGDIRDFDLLKTIMQDIDVVFHLAAQVHVERSYTDPKLTYDINVSGTQNILEISRINETQKVIFASSGEVYGSAQYVPIDENHPLNALHPYGASKIAADRMCNAYIQTYGVNISILRFFNIFGDRQRDIGYGGVIPIFARRVLSNKPPIIYGGGEQTRDYTYIYDAIRAYDSVLNHKGLIKLPINFGSGNEISVRDLAFRIIHLLGKDKSMAPEYDKPRIAEVNRSIADIKHAKEILGWEPIYSFEEGLKKFLYSFRNSFLDSG